jgi:steroid 5-alpha reductase family enzyme
MNVFFLTSLVVLLHDGSRAIFTHTAPHHFLCMFIETLVWRLVRHPNYLFWLDVVRIQIVDFFFPSFVPPAFWNFTLGL